jgi:hypothetical protein
MERNEILNNLWVAANVTTPAITPSPPPPQATISRPVKAQGLTLPPDPFVHAEWPVAPPGAFQMCLSVCLCAGRRGVIKLQIKTILKIL